MGLLVSRWVGKQPSEFKTCLLFDLERPSTNSAGTPLQARSKPSARRLNNSTNDTSDTTSCGLQRLRHPEQLES
jgi:hypothetical protein